MSKKLIETAIPVSAINQEAEKEKIPRNGLPRNVHLWWSRRSMTVARSVIFASCVDDPAEHPELFPSKEAQKKERIRLLRLTEALSKIENTTNEILLAEARKEILRYAKEPFPAVFDPFAGGGGIPVEAQRLGFQTESSDINPVAVMITKLVTDIPSRFADNEPVHPHLNAEQKSSFHGALGYANDVKYYGEWMLAEAKKRIGHLFPDVKSPVSGNKLKVSTWIWARTVKCPNPYCKCEIPLSSSYDLAKKKGSEAWVEPYVEGVGIRFRIHRNDKSPKNKPKVAQTAVFKCPVCGEITSDSSIREYGTKHKFHSQLIAIVSEEGRKRLYAEPDKEQKEAEAIKAPKRIPHGTLPDFPTRFTPPLYGLTDYADLFTNRQLVFITTMIKLARKAQEKAEKDALKKGMMSDGVPLAEGGRGAKAYAEAIRTALVMVLSKLLDQYSNICSWNSSSGGSLRNVFSRAAMPMIWDYAEANPFNTSGGSFLNALLRTCESLERLPVFAACNTVLRDGTLPNNVRGAILSTELPFYDKTGYADLSDFFYVWLKFGLGDIYPDYFKTEVTQKEEELTAFTYRWHGDRMRANAFYAEGISLVMKSVYESVTEDYPATVAFQYRRNSSNADETLSEWEIFVNAVSNAGFSITASWPLGGKTDNSVELMDTSWIPITVMLRKREKDAPQITRRNFVAAMKNELPVIVAELRNMVSLGELRASVIGRALNIYTRYSNVFDADGTNMKPYMASRIIEQELDTILTPFFLSDKSRGECEEDKDNVR